MSRILLLLLLLALGTSGLGWVAVHKALEHEPAFYARAMQQPPEVQEVAGIELEKDLLDLHNQVRHAGRWEASFEEDELNGWLAVDLPMKFPRLLPREASDPRLGLRDGQVLLACRYRNKKLDSVVSIAMHVQLTEQPNEVAIRVVRARAGAMPLPLAKLLDQVSHAARREGIRLRWTEEGGDPVALVRVSPRHPEFPDRQIMIETLQIDGGQLVLGGYVDGDTIPTRTAALGALELGLRLPLEAASKLILQ